ncbi:serine hydrolase [Brachybacterium sp. FME24]|uniref:serine hydrolase n=1 Tax=Brachybacterium sp. FME24 TaxID=2742605 RepID=UPI001868BC6D|nr:serine hydrolase [Brachybacterium sp. FME24]
MSIPTAAAPEHVAVSSCLLDADGEVLAAEEADRPYYAASTIKLHVLLAALRAADAGTLDLDGTVAATRTFTGSDGAAFTLGGDHLDATHPADGERIPVRELLQRMIDRSSNEATNHLVELVGLAAVAGAIASLGLTATRMERLIGDASALGSGATNETSAADLVVTMRALVRHGEGLSTSSVDSACTVLRAQRIPVIAAALRDGVPWGSKSGWVDGYRHDVAFIGDPDGEDFRVLAVMTAGMDQDDADRRIAALVREQLPDVAAGPAR